MLHGTIPSESRVEEIDIHVRKVTNDKVTASITIMEGTSKQAFKIRKETGLSLRNPFQ